MQPHSCPPSIFQGCFSTPSPSAMASRKPWLSEAIASRWANKHFSGHCLRAGLQLTAEADRLSHVHCVEVCGVASSGPPLPQIHSFFPIRTGLSSHFWKQRKYAMSSLAAARTQLCGLPAPSPKVAQCWKGLVGRNIKSHILTLFLVKHTFYFLAIMNRVLSFTSTLCIALSQSFLLHNPHHCLNLWGYLERQCFLRSRLVLPSLRGLGTLLVCRGNLPHAIFYHTISGLFHLSAHLPVDLKAVNLQASASGYKALAQVLVCKRSQSMVKYK